ncbi:MAG: hypothetical protein JW871_04245 [Endomicrobiales bacterium]|nr:hypothetical protein [Endomicrobiales bacterium]
MKIILVFIIIYLSFSPCFAAQPAEKGSASDEAGSEKVMTMEEYLQKRLEYEKQQKMQEMEEAIKRRSFSGFLYSVGRGGYFRVLFLISLNLLFLAFMFLIISHFSTFDFPPAVRVINVSVLLITLVPVVVGVASLFIGAHNYMMALTFAGWFFILIVIGIVLMQKKVREERLAKEGKYWRCPKCKTFNDNVYMRCSECDASRP